MFLLEVLPVFLFDGMLQSFSPQLIYQNYETKLGHVRKEGEFHIHHNLHANHHYCHNKNYSTYSCLWDVLFQITWKAE